MRNLPGVGVGVRNRRELWSPRDLPSPWGWWSASPVNSSRGVTLNGSRVSNVADVLGSGRSWVQATAGNQPDRTASINGRFALVGTQARTDNVVCAPAAPLTGTKLALFAALKRGTFVNVASPFSTQDNPLANDGTEGPAFTMQDSPNGTLTVVRAAGVLATKTFPTDGSAFSMCVLFDGTNNTVYVNGVAGAPVASNAAFNIQKMCFNARLRPTPAIPGNWSVAEWFVATGTLTARDLFAAHEYLRVRYL